MLRHIQKGLETVTPTTGNTWRDVVRVEASGARTVLATVLPFLVGQLMHAPETGMMVGLGGLYTCLADKQGARVSALLATALGSALAVCAATAVSTHQFVAVPLMFVCAFVCGMLGAFGPVAANVGFLLTLVFAVGLGLPPTYLHFALPRFVDFLGGGLWATLLTTALWRLIPSSRYSAPLGPEKAAESAPPLPLMARLKAHLTPDSPILQHAVRLSVVSTLAVALYKGFYLHLKHGSWIIITALVIVKPDYHSTWKRAMERMIGSVVGGILALIFAAFVRNLFAIDALLVVLALLAFSHVRRSYGTYVVFLTPFIVLMLDALDPGDWQLALSRIGTALAGGALALVVAYLLRPEETPIEGVG